MDEKKYLKYKAQYLKLKSQKGGGEYSKEIIDYLTDKGSAWLQKNYQTYSGVLQSFNLNELVITHDLKTIKNIYDEHNYIQLRKYNNEKKLIIGCGNRRLDNRNMDPCTSTNDCNLIHENIHHAHTEAFTIDSVIMANSSIIGTFDKDSKFLTLRDNSFDIIIFEGGGNPTDNPNEVKRLLNKNNLSFCIANSPTNGSYIIYSYWNDGIYVNNDF